MHVTAGELTISSQPRASLSRRLTWAGWLASAAMAGIAFVIQLSTDGAWIPGAYGFPGFTSLFALTSGTVGAVVVSRQPSNRIGLLLLVAGIGFAFQSLYTEYGIAAYLTYRGPLPFADLAAWLVAWAWLPPVFLVGPLLLSIFPDGHLLSPRWALAPAMAGMAGAVFMALSAFESGPINNFAIVENPLGFIPADLALRLIQPTSLVLAVGFMLPAASLVIRYRRSGTERRHQLKWIAASAVVLAGVAPFGFASGRAGQIAFILAFCGIPVATGIAILRYRLYDIDTIINRALVYGLLTAIIAGIYTASIGLMQRLSQTFTGADSQATVVVTTVLIVTAFTPVKSRLQTLVDRRFRDAGDAKAALEPFVKALQERMWAVEPRLVLRRFAELLIVALRATSVDVSLVRDGGQGIAGTAQGAGAAGQAWSAASTVGPSTLRIQATLGVRGISSRDEATVIDALTAVATELDAVR